ncbi:MAG: hypothetical protein HQ483_05770 [Rhodospirillales bacterium]|nr:hypothetical protein [Rhodospirillales bacterium]
MRFSDELLTALPGEDWQRIETWAAIAGMTPAQYLSLCIRRGHALVKEDLKRANNETSLIADVECTG